MSQLLYILSKNIFFFSVSHVVYLDVPERVGYNLFVDGVYWGYNPLTNHLLTFWDIQVPGVQLSSPLFFQTSGFFRTSFRRGGHGSFPEEQVALTAPPRRCVTNLVQDFFFRFETCGHTWDVPGSHHYMVSKWLISPAYKWSFCWGEITH